LDGNHEEVSAVTVSPQEAFVDEQRRMSWEPLRIRSEEFPNLATAKDFDMSDPQPYDNSNIGGEPAEEYDRAENTQAEMPDPHTHYQLPEVAKNVAKASDNLKEAAGIFQRATQKSQQADSAMQAAKAHYDDRKATMAAWMKEMEDFTS
jgi:hypothetical protein